MKKNIGLVFACSLNKQMIIYLIFVYCLLFFCGRNEKLIAADPVLLKNADELIGEQLGNMNVRRLLGNVILQQKNVVVHCNSAIQYLNENKFVLKGNVVITQDSLILRSNSIIYDGNKYLATADSVVDITDGKTKLIGDRGTYSTRELIANFYNNVKLEDDTIIVLANNIIYNRKTSDSKAIGNVIVKSKEKNVILMSDTLDNLPNKQLIVASGNPLLFQIDTIFSNDSNSIEKFDTLTIKSDRMVANRSKKIDKDIELSDRYDFQGNVELIRANVKGKSDFASYFVDDEKIIMNCIRENKTQVIIWLDSTQLNSDSVSVKLHNNKLEKLYAFGNAIALSSSDTIRIDRIDQLSGDEIIINVDKDTVRTIESIGSAKGVFFSNNNQEPDGVITNEAEKILITMEDGKADKIYFSNQIVGAYTPEPIVFGKEYDYYLNNFRKLDTTPQRPNINFR
jgi:lipopolysaccharide export system protein LptA